MRILITGATGFIGRHVAHAAHAKGHTVRLLSRTPYSKAVLAPGSRVENSTHDLRRLEGLAAVLAGVDSVIHCAALLSGSDADQQAVTVRGTEHLLAAMDTAGVSRIVNISSFAVYDYLALPDGASLTEGSKLEDSFQNRAPYIRAKKTQEDLVRDHGRRQGWQVTTVRPGLVYGPGRTWFHHLGIVLSSRLWISLSGKSKLPLTYVENCADAIVLANDTKAAAGEVLNIVDDNPPERRGYLRELARRATPKPMLVDVPWGFLSFCASAANGVNRAVLRGKAPLPDLARPASLAARSKPLEYPNEQAKRVLGWSPRLTLVEALDRSL